MREDDVKKVKEKFQEVSSAFDVRSNENRAIVHVL